MRILKIVLFFVVIFLLSNEVYTIITPSAKSPKKIKAVKKTNCCILNVLNLENVQLDKLCQTNGSTIVYMHLLNTANACSYLKKISLTDNNGNAYKPIALHGIANCPNINQIKANIAFSWEFEKLANTATSIYLQEDLNSPAPQSGSWNWWGWENVSVSHCKL